MASALALCASWLGSSSGEAGWFNGTAATLLFHAD